MTEWWPLPGKIRVTTVKDGYWRTSRVSAIRRAELSNPKAAR
ncbi:hypothetical protein JOF36_003239 [Pseudonocardia parietis]|uniref:Uncharacterized protein n=1 Tax=Pseudonocardia parietis TaxID=570936 RepID=A0ABS4VUD6_9PSEU|nr:hypothetical protein [Pseudonocardia parietis]